MIGVRELRVERGGTQVLSVDRLDLEAGLVAVMGPNGAGKSTLLETLAGRLLHTGRIEHDGAWFVGPEPPARVLVDVAEVVRSHGGADPRALLERVGYAGPDQLARGSSGERMLVALAGALARPEPHLLLDEPLGHLDPPHVARLLPVWRARARDAVVLLTTHDPTVAARADRVLLLDGSVVADGEPRQVLQPEPLGRCYGCPMHVRWTEAGPVVRAEGPDP